MNKLMMRIGLVAEIVMLTAAVFPVSADQSPATPQQRDSSGQPRVEFKVKRVRSRRLASRIVNTDSVQLRNRSFLLLNRERLNRNVPPLKRNAKLDRLAARRARQISVRFSHYDHHDNTMTHDDAPAVKLPHDFSGAENIASAGLGRCMSIGDPRIYHNRDGNDMAAMTNDAMMNHDQLEQNGHRKNILSPDNTLVGVGAAYSPRKREFYLAEDFGSRDPASSEDVRKASPAKKNQAAEHLLLKRAWRHGEVVIKRWFRRIFGSHMLY